MLLNYERRILWDFIQIPCIPNKDSIRYKYLHDLIAKRLLYFSKPTQLNDPFDCYPTMSFGETVQKQRYNAERIIKEKRAELGQPILSPSQLQKEIKQFLKRYNDKIFINSTLYNSISTNSGIHSFSKTCTSIPQWTYYADEHKGIVLEFEINKTHGLPFSFEVDYKEKRIVLDFPRYRKDEKYSHEMLQI